MSSRPYGFKISPLLQEHMCRLGSKLVFSEASEELGLLLGLSVNAKQIERLCHLYGELLEQQRQEGPFSAGDGKNPVTYCMADGSMLLTREEKWKEIKLGRIFSEESHLDEISKGRGYISNSLYCAHFGNSEEFWDRFTNMIPVRAEPVFICDGAKWLWNNIDAYYPGSVQILDYYHCKVSIRGATSLPVQ